MHRTEDCPAKGQRLEGVSLAHSILVKEVTLTAKDAHSHFNEGLTLAGSCT
jgi:hypothetical protein